MDAKRLGNPLHQEVGYAQVTCRAAVHSVVEVAQPDLLNRHRSVLVLARRLQTLGSGHPDAAVVAL